MQKIVLFIEPCDEAYVTLLKIGNLFMNRFAVEEDAAFEVLKIFELEMSSWKMYDLDHSEYEKERKQKGMDLISNFDVFFISKLKSDKKVYSIEMGLAC